MTKNIFVYRQKKYGNGLVFVKARDEDHARTKLMTELPNKSNDLELVGNLVSFLSKMLKKDKDIIKYLN